MAEELGFIVFVLGEKDGVVTELEYPVQHVDPTAAEKEGVQEAQKEGYTVKNATVERA
mgnify:CR=1 FL=1